MKDKNREKKRLDQLLLAKKKDEKSNCPRYRPVPEFPSYRVGEDGTVWAFRWDRKEIGRWKLLRGTVNSKRRGYLRVWLQRKGKVKVVLVHRLILEVFRGPCPEGEVGCHNDDNPLNNDLGNLRWDTLRENMKDIVWNGGIKSGCKRGSRLTKNQVS